MLKTNRQIKGTCQDRFSLEPALNQLQEYLESCGINTSIFGTGSAKTLSWLLQEKGIWGAASKQELEVEGVRFDRSYRRAAATWSRPRGAEPGAGASDVDSSGHESGCGRM